jgi:hypothetical protein
VLRIGADTPGHVTVRHTSDGATVYVRAESTAHFPEDRFARYQDFVGQPGHVLKDESRTHIARISLTTPGQAPRDFAVKEYRYSAKSQLRTWYRQSTAHAEFAAACHLLQFGIPTVLPAACGLRRSAIGTVASCFLITEFADGFVSLRDWFRGHPSPTPQETVALDELAATLGRAVRTMHEHRFFVSRLSAKNLLVRANDSGGFDWLFIDHPFADFHRSEASARFMQLYDLGRMKNSVLRFGQAAFFENLLAAYLPDPLGRDEAALRRSIEVGVGIRQSRRPLQRLFRHLINAVRPGRAQIAI